MENNTTTSTAPTQPSPAKLPPPTTLTGKLRAKLPGRGWMIFWGVVGTIGGLVTRDHYLTVAAKKRVSDRVDVLAKQTCGVQDMPRKVTVYIMPPPGDGIHKTRHYFRQFVKPVFDAAALDYEVREGLTEGQIQAMVAADIRRKRQVAAGKTDELTEKEKAMAMVPMKSLSDGIVVLGRVALSEVLKGYQDGCFQTLDDPVPAEPVLAADPEVVAEPPVFETTTEETPATGASEPSGDENASRTDSPSSTPAAEEAASTDKPAQAETPKENEVVVIAQDEEFFSLPPSGLEPIGFIPFKNLVGIRNWPKKFYAIFNSWDCVEYAGASVMKVAFAETKDLEKEDLSLGKDEEELFKKYRGPVELDITDRVRENVKLFVTPQHIPEPKTYPDEADDSLNAE
ncbi:mitochondrial import inner membrane translocase subunit tim54 [Lunasporangiospora selenospora]|uniref:Mitochondrial import inner membrane translocase subunit TIM54 n=1 Tax=Lunasporangiospora selenospora TaxID=979761 RepID=A0A9P6KDA5_9FUNG|nr:mitochondrial import inner membrane translocase subunit tim54 [Lunasporangiospora selenospora]